MVTVYLFLVPRVPLGGSRKNLPLWLKSCNRSPPGNKTLSKRLTSPTSSQRMQSSLLMGGKSILTAPVVVGVEYWIFSLTAEALAMASPTPTANWLRTAPTCAPWKRHASVLSAVVKGHSKASGDVAGVVGVVYVGKRAWISFWNAMLLLIPRRRVICWRATLPASSRSRLALWSCCSWNRSILNLTQPVFELTASRKGMKMWGSSSKSWR